MLQRRQCWGTGLIGSCRDGAQQGGALHYTPRQGPVPSSLVVQCPSERHGHDRGPVSVWAPRRGVQANVWRGND